MRKKTRKLAVKLGEALGAAGSILRDWETKTPTLQDITDMQIALSYCEDVLAIIRDDVIRNS